MRSAGQVRLLAALLVAALAAGGCSAWNTIDPPKTGFAVAADEQGRLTLDDGTKLEVSRVRIDGDSVRFVADGDSLVQAQPTSRITRYEKKDSDVFGTVLLAAGLGVVFFYGIAILRGINSE